MTINFGINISKISGNKNAILSMTLILLLTTTLMMAFAQPTSAQINVPQPEKTVAFCTVAPTLIGVGQQLTCNIWVNPLPTLANDQPGFYGFKGLVVTFVRPDGTKDTFMPTDATGAYPAGMTESNGAQYFFYKPNMAGNWSMSFTMPAQNITDTEWNQDYGNVTQYTACTSNSFSFTVQTGTVLAGLLNGYPWASLPNANVYWSYPINDNNREWNQISGDWTGMSATSPTVISPSTELRYQPYGPGPSTAHIVWKQPVKEGGIIGGAYGSYSYVGSNTVYGAPNSYYVIMDGKVFCNLLNTQPPGQSFGQFRCWDLATGQVLYTANGTISYGIHLPGTTYMQSSASSSAEGGLVTLAGSYGSDYQPYLFGTATINGSVYWLYYDALTGVLAFQFNNCGSAKPIDGTYLAYGTQSLTATTDTSLNGYVYCWNMSAATTIPTAVGGSYNWNAGVTWKKIVPMPPTGGIQTASGTAATYRGPALFAISADNSVIVIQNSYEQYLGYSATTGASLWNLTLNYQTDTNEEIPLGDGVNEFVIFDPTANVFNAYSEMTGALLWTTPSFASSPWTTVWTVYNSETNDLNNFYAAFPDGIVRAYSLTDGHLVWASTAIASTEHDENVLPYWYAGTVMMGGLIYVYDGYSIGYEINPVSRFSMLVAINATNGATVFTLNGGILPTAAANGYVVGSGIYDGYLYCVGKGTTSTTVTAQQQVGGSVLIQGSVLDKSPASSNPTIAAVFPTGVPAISDDNMSVWMDYLHMQNATLLNTPPAVNGVPVTLNALDPNGNYITIGTTTSYGSGVFNYQWTPTTPGLYQIYATFAGSNSYFSSYAQTGATVASVASTTTTPAPTVTSEPSNLATTTDLMTYIVAVGIAIIIAIAIVGALILRKK